MFDYFKWISSMESPFNLGKLAFSFHVDTFSVFF